MKGKVFGLVVVTAIGIGVIRYLGYLGGDTVQIRAKLVSIDCGDGKKNKNMDMQVSAVSDSSLVYLIGKTISPEAAFKQSKLNTFVQANMVDIQSDKNDFLLVGHIRQSPIPHCSGSVCFKVEMIKQQSEGEFTDF